MKKGLWETLFNDVLFADGKVPSPEEKKKMYDLCYRQVRRKIKKEGLTLSKEEINEEISDCLRDKLYAFQLETEEVKKNIGTAFETGRINRQREEREFAEDIRALNRINRDFYSSDREEREEERIKQNKKLKREIEEKIRRESGYY